MQSDGGLSPVDLFSGHKAILSGPAGGLGLSLCLLLPCVPGLAMLGWPLSQGLIKAALAFACLLLVCDALYCLAENIACGHMRLTQLSDGAGMWATL